MGSPAGGSRGAVRPATPSFRYPYQNGKLKVTNQNQNQMNRSNSVNRLPARSNGSPTSNHALPLPNFISNPGFGPGQGQRMSSPSLPRIPQQYNPGPANNRGFCPNNNWNYRPRPQYNQHYNGSNRNDGNNWHQQRFNHPPRGRARFPNARGRGDPYQRPNDGGSYQQPRANNNDGPRFQNQNQSGGYNDKPWITPELKDLIRQRNVLQKRAQLLRNAADWNEFKELRQRITCLLNTAKFDYEIKLSSQPKSERIFYCDTCDKTCLNQKGLDEHDAEHIVCKLDGCVFTAHPKVVLKHIQMQHATNLFHRIKGYKTEEEIKQWVDDRKKNFPTTKNLKRKKAADSEKQARGERIPKTPKFKYSINQADKVKEKYKYGQNRKPGGNPQNTSNALISANKYDNKDYIHAKNTSEMVTLENYYAVVKVGEKRKLIGKKLMLWTQNATKVKSEETNNDCKSSDEDDTCDVTNLSISDEDEIEMHTLDDPSTTSTVSRRVSDDVRERSSTSVSENESAAAGSTTNMSSGLAGLLMYGGSDSESEGEIVDSSDNEPPDEVQIQRKIPSPEADQYKIQASSTHRVNQNPSKGFKPKQINGGKGKGLHPATNDAGSEKTDDKEFDNQKSVQRKEKQLNRKQHQRALKLRRIAHRKTLKNPQDSAGKCETSRPDETLGVENVDTPNGSRHDRPTTSAKRWTGNKAVRPQFKPRPRWRPPTLLERLLADDIEREGNYLLQACRYIVENKFFGMEKRNEPVPLPPENSEENTEHDNEQAAMNMS